MKTKEELNELKNEVKDLNAKLAELSEDELKEVTGGVTPSSKTVAGIVPFISIVLIIASLGLCACKSNDKRNKDTMNVAYFSYDTTKELFEAKEYLDVEEFEEEVFSYVEDINVLTDPETYYDVINDKSCEIAGDRLIFDMRRQGLLSIMDVYGYLGGFPVIATGLECQGLSITIEYHETPKYDIDRYAESYGSFDEDCETSENVCIRYSTTEFGDFGRYEVLVAVQDSKSGSIVVMRYDIPTEDNEDEIQELRELGIPVITDFIEQD